jgi:hypothetical protein
MDMLVPKVYAIQSITVNITSEFECIFRKRLRNKHKRMATVHTSCTTNNCNNWSSYHLEHCALTAVDGKPPAYRARFRNAVC